jgi:hypothetical protein
MSKILIYVTCITSQRATLYQSFFPKLKNTAAVDLLSKSKATPVTGHEGP